MGERIRLTVTTDERAEKPVVRVTSAEEFLEDIFKTRYFVDGVLKASYERGQGKLIVVTGENATGKSFFRRLIQAAFGKHGLEVLALSMEFRASASGLARVMVCGDERRDATSSNTGHMITRAITTSRNRTTEHAIVWDEPEIGLSDNYAAGAADAILEFAADPPELLQLVAVVTHRRVMLERLAAAKPHHVRLGDDKTLAEVLSAPLEPRSLADLDQRNRALHDEIRKNYDL